MPSDYLEDVCSGVCVCATLTLCTVAPRLASTVRESVSTLRLYVCPVTKYDLKQYNDDKMQQRNPEKRAFVQK